MFILRINEEIFYFFNGLAGRSWALDTLISILETNALAKGALVGACLTAVWYMGRGSEEKIRVRKTLIATIIGTILSLAVSKTLSHTIFFPRPYILSETLYHLEGNDLVEYKQIKFRVPLDEESQKLHSAYLDGNISVNPLGTIPSDHASFFLAMSLGIILVCRPIGLVALLWTLLAILTTKIITGKHFPIDLVAGALVGVAGLFAVIFAARRLLEPYFSKAASWTLEHERISSALLFVVVFEISSTLQHIYPMFDYFSIVFLHLLRL